MADISTAITNVGTIITSGLGVVTGEPLFMIGIGFALLISGVGFAKRMIG